MAEPKEGYCPDAMDEIERARVQLLESQIPEKPTETTEKRLMRPQTGQDVE